MLFPTDEISTGNNSLAAAQPERHKMQMADTVCKIRVLSAWQSLKPVFSKRNFPQRHKITISFSAKIINWLTKVASSYYCTVQICLLRTHIMFVVTHGYFLSLQKYIKILRFTSYQSNLSTPHLQIPEYFSTTSIDSACVCVCVNRLRTANSQQKK